MSNIKCIIVEDEFPALEILKSYLGKISGWELVAAFDNALDAITYLSKNKVDVIFLDIQLPELNGIDFIKAIENPPLIVITSAYNEHAVEAFELVVFDYLLKPYSFQRFIKSITRINNHFESNKNELDQIEETFIYVKENRKNIKISVDAIIYIESLKEYVNIVCADSEVKTKIGISKIEKMLADVKIVRVHRSFMVSLDKITSFTNTQLMLDQHLIPIGKLYQKEILKELQ